MLCLAPKWKCGAWDWLMPPSMEASKVRESVKMEYFHQIQVQLRGSTKAPQTAVWGCHEAFTEHSKLSSGHYIHYCLHCKNGTEHCPNYSDKLPSFCPCLHYNCIVLWFQLLLQWIAQQSSMARLDEMSSQYTHHILPLVWGQTTTCFNFNSQLHFFIDKSIQ